MSYGFRTSFWKHFLIKFHTFSTFKLALIFECIVNGRLLQNGSQNEPKSTPNGCQPEGTLVGNRSGPPKGPPEGSQEANMAPKMTNLDPKRTNLDPNRHHKAHKQHHKTSKKTLQYQNWHQKASKRSNKGIKLEKIAEVKRKPIQVFNAHTTYSLTFQEIQTATFVTEQRPTEHI